jgi:hypothetical protein
MSAFGGKPDMTSAVRMSAFDPKRTFIAPYFMALMTEIDGQANRNRPAFRPPGGRMVTASVHREAVKQAGAAGALQRLRAATARGMRRIPRVRRRIVA